MASRFQAATLVASPSYPNSVAWSDENLIAVASGHLVTILNAAMPLGPRGLIAVHKSEPYPIGVIKGEELLSGRLLHTCMSRDSLPRVRSISWSPMGMAVNSGCLLAVCTSEGHVKLYRPPFCDFCADWIEVFDIADRLYEYLASISFRKQGIPGSEISDEPERNHGCGDDPLYSISGKAQKRRRVKASGPISGCTDLETSSNQLSYSRTAKYRSVNLSSSFGTEGQDLAEVLNATSDELIEYTPQKAASANKSKRKNANKTPEDCTLPLISTDQYAFRSEMLASVVVSWSPMLKLSSEICLISENDSSNWFSLLAVGSQSGKISFWKIHAPHSYSIEQGGVPLDVALVGLLQAHNSWITTISWAFLTSNSSNPKVVLATGSSDGSVRTWLGHGEFLRSSEVRDAPFILLQEIVHVNPAPVSVVSLTVPDQSLQTILLAVGNGSGALEIWKSDNNITKFDKVASCDAHDQVITGLAWAFEGHCLYSCSQDNFVRSWILCGNSFSEVPIPPSPGLRSFNDLPDAFISCLGVAVSPGNTAVAMVRKFDTEKLNQMYEARIQKAAVEFFWIGGQQWNCSPVASLEFSAEAVPGFSDKDLHYWMTNTLWSLRQFEHVDKPLVAWDIIAALLVFKQSSPEFVDHILVKWLSMSFLGSDKALSAEKLAPLVSKKNTEVSSRKLHLLNLICRRVMLSDLKASEINKSLQNIGGLDGAKNDKPGLWMDRLASSERELRQRLVALTFSAFITSSSNLDTKDSQPGYWYPSGLAQMEQWVEQNSQHVSDQVKLLSSEVKTHKRYGVSEHEAEEQCSFCSASVSFESLEIALCRGSKRGIGCKQKHELPRCAVSMQVCPATPLWLCKCCYRSSFNLPPETLFTMPRFSLDYKSLPESFLQNEISKPLCPFCGILLQRSQPEFLLSPLPVLDFKTKKRLISSPLGGQGRNAVRGEALGTCNWCLKPTQVIKNENDLVCIFA